MKSKRVKLLLLLGAIGVGILVFLLFFGFPQKTHEKPKSGEEDFAVIELSGGKKIVVELYSDSAPKTVENFKKLVQKGFYNGLAFHRVVPGFVAQGGDPDGNGNGGPGYTIPAEFNNRPHVTGTLGMARGSDPNSAGSQFYICLSPQPDLDKKYTVFGQVVEGMEHARNIKVGDLMKRVYIKKPSS